MSFLLPLFAGGLFVIIGAHLTIIGASLLGVSLMAFGLSVPLLAVTVRNFNDEMAGPE